MFSQIQGGQKPRRRSDQRNNQIEIFDLSHETARAFGNAINDSSSTGSRPAFRPGADGEMQPINRPIRFLVNCANVPLARMAARH